MESHLFIFYGSTRFLSWPWHSSWGLTYIVSQNQFLGECGALRVASPRKSRCYPYRSLRHQHRCASLSNITTTVRPPYGPQYIRTAARRPTRWKPVKTATRKFVMEGEGAQQVASLCGTQVTRFSQTEYFGIGRGEPQVSLNHRAETLFPLFVQAGSSKTP